MIMLSINDLCYEIDGRMILNHLNATVEKGQVVVITGHNGSGKSTLLKLIHQWHSHEVVIPAKAGTQENLSALMWASLRGNGILVKKGKSVMLHQNINDNLFCGLTIAENFKLVGMKDLTSIEAILSRFKSQPALNTIVSQLSGGERQRLALYMRLFMNPDILLLDEHTSALDPETSESLMQETLNLAKQNNIITCIMITHDMNLIHNLPCVRWEMENGRFIHSLL